jgi:hypothetical protein
MTRVEIERGLGDGSLVKGAAERTAEGDGDKPPPGHLLLPGDVDKVVPMPKGREVVGWLVVGPGYRLSAKVTRWRVPVVAVGRA